MHGGVTFPNGMTDTTACSPSRATLWTGTYPMINDVDSVGQNPTLTDQLTTLGLLLTEHAPVSYNVAYKGTSGGGTWATELVKQIPVNGLTNGGSASSAAVQKTWNEMHEALTQAMNTTHTTPKHWPPAPSSVPSDKTDETDKQRIPS